MDLAWLWLWRRVAAAALIRPLAWEPPYATCSPKKPKKERERKRERERERERNSHDDPKTKEPGWGGGVMLA